MGWNTISIQNDYEIHASPNIIFEEISCQAFGSLIYLSQVKLGKSKDLNDMHLFDHYVDEDYEDSTNIHLDSVTTGIFSHQIFHLSIGLMWLGPRFIVIYANQQNRKLPALLATIYLAQTIAPPKAILGDAKARFLHPKGYVM